MRNSGLVRSPIWFFTDAQVVSLRSVCSVY